MLTPPKGQFQNSLVESLSRSKATNQIFDQFDNNNSNKLTQNQKYAMQEQMQMIEKGLQNIILDEVDEEDYFFNNLIEDSCDFDQHQVVNCQDQLYSQPQLHLQLS